MALGYTTYKTPNAIYTIHNDLSGCEGFGVKLYAQGEVKIADSSGDVPYAIVTVGGPSEDGVTYPGLIGGSSVEFVDMLGCTVQVTISGTTSVAAGDFLQIDDGDANGTFTLFQLTTPGQWLWGVALTNAGPGEQCLMRFQPQVVQYVPTPP